MGEVQSHHVAGFHISHKAWYAASRPSRKLEITIGYYDPEDGSTAGEFAIRWHNLGSSMSQVPRLEVFEDGWQALWKMEQDHGLVKALGDLDGTMPGPEDMEVLLLLIGLRDLTARKRE